MSSLRQFAQREAAEVCGFASAAVDLLTEDDPAASMISAGLSGTSSTSHLPDPPGVVTIRLNYQLGLPGMLFSLLDYETDGSLVSDIHDTLSSIMASMASDNLQSWLALCREVLNDQNKPGAAATTGSGHDKIGSPGHSDDEEDPDQKKADDDTKFTFADDPDAARRALMIQPRWTTRVFAAQCLRKIIQECCQGNRAHYDLTLAREIQLTPLSGDFLVLHLPELVGVAYVAAISDADPLRLEGLRTLQVIIEMFGETPEPEPAFPGQVILEQHQAQVGAAVRPAFSEDTPSHVTAAACDVCSAWIGSGVARNLRSGH